MIESMTGYGRSTGKLGGRSLVVEIKSVNSKFLETRVHLPKEFVNFDSQINTMLKGKLKRGYIDFFLNVVEEPYSQMTQLIDVEKAKIFYREARKLKKELKLSGEMDINSFLRFREFFPKGSGGKAIEKFDPIKKIIEGAVSKLKKMRSAEGRNLEEDIRQRLAKILVLVNQIDKNKEVPTQLLVDRLAKRLDEIKGNLKFDPGRLEQEIVLYVARTDINEEITRLKSHLKRMNEFLAKGGSCGRNLDFVVQEMHREANTMGSKSQINEISGDVIEIKSELEKIREQVQNIE